MSRGTMAFASILKKLRANRGLSQHQLAKRAGVTHTNLVKLEAGVKDNPTLKTLIKLANGLDVSIDELAGRKK